MWVGAGLLRVMRMGQTHCDMPFVVMPQNGEIHMVRIGHDPAMYFRQVLHADTVNGDNDVILFYTRFGGR